MPLSGVHVPAEFTGWDLSDMVCNTEPALMDSFNDDYSNLTKLYAAAGYLGCEGLLDLCTSKIVHDVSSLTPCACAKLFVPDNPLTKEKL